MSVRETVAAILGGRLRYEDGLDALTVAPAGEVDRVLTGMLRETAAGLFGHGWQPVELHRAVARRGDPVRARLVAGLVAAHLAAVPGDRVDPRWRAQAGELGADAWWAGEDDHLTAAARRWRVDRVAMLDAALGLLEILAALPRIEVLVPPPGSVARGARPQRVDERLLDRVRALLAKAESTGFPSEAEAYSGKAQELIARHSLAEALADGPAAEVVPLARRIGVDHPYEGEKAALLDAVARANRCRTVWSPELGFTTVFGFDADIDAVELLYTSVLVQAHRALAAAEPPGGRGGKARLKTFRRSFLAAYAARVGDRLARVTRTAELAAGDLLPVLASREAQVRAAAERVFPHTVRARGARIDSLEGWESGRAAADRAALAEPV